MSGWFSSGSYEHLSLRGLYWLVPSNSNSTTPVYQKTAGRRAYLYRRGLDWIVGYDTRADNNNDDTCSSLPDDHHVLPGLLQLGAGHHHDEGPGDGGWLYLTHDREWLYDLGFDVFTTAKC